MTVTMDKQKIRGKIEDIAGVRFESISLSNKYTDVLVAMVANSNYNELDTLYNKLTMLWNWSYSMADELIGFLIKEDYVFFCNSLELCAWCQSYYIKSTGIPVFKLENDIYQTVSRAESHGCCSVCKRELVK